MSPSDNAIIILILVFILHRNNGSPTTPSDPTTPVNNPPVSPVRPPAGSNILENYFPTIWEFFRQLEFNASNHGIESKKQIVIDSARAAVKESPWYKYKIDAPQSHPGVYVFKQNWERFVTDYGPFR